MKLLGKLNSASLGKHLNQLSFKNLKNAEGLSFSSNEDIKRNICSVTFTKNVTEPFELGKEYELVIASDSPESSDSEEGKLVNIFESYRLDDFELSDDEKTATYKFHNVYEPIGEFIINASVDLLKYKSGDVVRLFIKF